MRVVGRDFGKVSSFVERAAVEDVDGGAEADGGGGLGAGEGFFEGVEGFDAELSEAVGRGFGEEGPVMVEGFAEGFRFLEPEVNGGAVDLGLSGGAGDGAAGGEVGQDFELPGGEVFHAGLILAAGFARAARSMAVSG